MATGTTRETARTIQDGWLKTGDIGHMDTERLRDDHRPQEGHDSGLGFKRLSQRSRRRRHGASSVAECAVIGVPDEHQANGPSRDRKKDPSLTKEDIIAYCVRPAHRLQAAAPDRVPRQPAEDADQQDPAAVCTDERAGHAQRRATSAPQTGADHSRPGA